ncbi:MAG TPA: D-alanyl-D-alanine carboxypeptidase/D-alanyl-D-alanine-endopeptidase [Conexibacter sp.]|nr:D-alanyl-D-alanine carboxypeptidase/D-alanyl-D-alanine-endopeptidase [Conexibacter sp.]
MRRSVQLLVLLALTACTGSATAAPLDARVANGLARAGGVSSGYVLDTTTGRTLASVRADTPRIPASVNKLYTTSTALLRFGPDATLTTRVLGMGTLDDAGTWHGDLYLRGGGDPTFGSASFDRLAYGLGTTVSTLAARVRAAGILRVTGRVRGDESWLDPLRGGPATGYRLDLDIGGPLGGLLFNRGLAREDGSALQAQPAKFAAQQLTLELRRAHVPVAHGAAIGTAPEDAEAIAIVDSPTMATLVRLTLVPSDNLFAEMLLKDVGARFGSAGSTAAGVTVVKRTLARFGIRPQIADGSGLSRVDRTSPRQVVTLLSALRANAELRAALPVAGRSGTLAERMRRTSAQDRCQAKTGTLSNVSALAGYCRTPNGHLLAFAFIENLVYTPTAKKAEDQLAIAIARTRPGGTPLTVPVSQPTTPTTPTPVPSGGGATPAVR